MKIISINGKTEEEREKERSEDLYVPHHTDRWYNRSERSWVVQLKDKYDNQIGEAKYVYSKQEAINAENNFKKEYKLSKEKDNIKLKNYRKCNGCKAITCNSTGALSYHCDLGYKTGSKYGEIIPLEPCPKPKTNDQYILCSRKPY